MVAALARRGYRVTPQRLAICEVLARSRHHPTAADVWAEVRRRYPMVGRATVYKTIETLRELGQVLELRYDDAAHYDGAAPAPHPHVVCTRCGRIEEAPSGSLDETARSMAAAVGYEFASHRFDVFGLCPSCVARGSRGAPRRTSRSPAASGPAAQRGGR